MNIHFSIPIAVPNRGLRTPFLTLFIIAGLILAACQPIQPVPEEEAGPAVQVTPQGGDQQADAVAEDTQSDVVPTEYMEPNGLYTVPIPTNWTAEQKNGYATLSSPGAGITVDIVSVNVDDVEAALEAAWGIVDPTFADEVEDRIDIPGSVMGDVDELVVFSYEREDEDPIVQVEVRRVGDITYVLIFRLDLIAAQQRAAQIQLIDTGFTIHALEETDLTNAATRPLDDALLAELEAYIEQVMEQLNVPGAAVSIVQGGDIVYANGFGVRDWESNEPMTPETLMMIGSTTKSMTTLMMAQLVDEGVFAWDTPVVEILPSFQVADPVLTEQLTIENLVCACTGVPRRDFEWLFNANELEAEDVIESLAEFQFFTDFGEAFQYSNQMVATAGYIATLAAGGEYGSLQADYETIFQERVLDPIGMEDSTFSFEEVTSGDNFAMPYGQLPTGEMLQLPLETEEILIPMGPAGALWSNVLDMSKYLITELRTGITPDGERIVSVENLTKTWEPQVEISADASYGLGWILIDYEGVQMISHGGNTFGFTSELSFMPEIGIGISVLTNQQGSALNQVVRAHLLELLFEQPHRTDELLQFQLEQIEEARIEFLDSLVETIDAEVMEPYLGDYSNDALGSMRLFWEGEQLLLDIGELQMEVRATEEEDGTIQYISYTPPLVGIPIEFAEGADGNPVIDFGIGVVEYQFQKDE